MRFSANVSILFHEYPFLERFDRAREAGFSAVEFWWPTGEDPQAVQRTILSADLRVALFNFDAGDMAGGDRGLVSDPSRRDRFRQNVPIALDLARSVGCGQLNALVGLRLPEVPYEEQWALARDNVGWAADRAAEHGVNILIEAVNTFENGPYLIHTTKQAANFVGEVARDNVKLQYDVYHMQRMEGNLGETLREHIGMIGHVQIADSPGRGEPGTGEIRYPFIFDLLDELGYDGYVGLEYRPSGGDTLESLNWLPKAGRSGDIALGDLIL